MTYEMSLKKYNDFVRSEERLMINHIPTIVETDVLALSNALGGECGELQNIMKKIISRNQFYSDSPLNEQFELEAGDVLWYLFRLIQRAGFSVETIMQKNMTKLESQYKTGVDKWRT